VTVTAHPMRHEPTRHWAVTVTWMHLLLIYRSRKDTVFGHGCHDRINIMAGKGIVEALQASLPLI